MLWLAFEPARLSAQAQQQLTDKGHAVAFSVASLWEVAIKTSLRRPGFEVDPQRLRAGLLSQGFTELLIKPEHPAHLLDLPWHHRDPFDRLLVAQAQYERLRLRLLTADKSLLAYGTVAQLI